MARRNPLVKKGALPNSSRSVGRQSTHLHLIRRELDADGQSEDAALSFDADDDVAAIIPMPPSIPRIVRAAITVTVARRFEFAEDLDAWLHAPNAVLGGATPFERIVDGDGIAVLRALRGSKNLDAVLRHSAAAVGRAELGLKIVR